MRKASRTGRLSRIVSGQRQDQLYVGLILLLVCVSYLPVLFYSQYAITDWFTTDDAFYYFKVAENIAAGKGVTFDGFARTNGFHPLWMILITPWFVFSSISKYLPLRLIVLLQMVLAAGSGFYFYKLCRGLCSKITALLASSAWVLLPALQVITSNGTEAGLNTFLLTFFWYRLVIFQEKIQQKTDQWQDYLILGLIGAGLVFARLDNIFLLMMVGLWLFFLPLLRKFKRIPDFTGKNHIRNLLVFFVPLGAFLLLYFLVNVICFDTMMPVSGQVKKWWGTLAQPAYGSPVKGLRNFLGEFFSPEKAVGPWWILTGLIISLSNSLPAYYHWGTRSIPIGLFIALGLFFLLGFLVSERKNFLRKVLWNSAFLPLLGGALSQIAYYKIFGYLAPRSWYWIIEYFLIFISGAVVLEMILITFRRAPSPIGSILLLFTAGLVLTGLIGPQTARYSPENFMASEAAPYYQQKAAWLEHHTEPGTLVGMTGAGSTAYFIESRTIINLDGLINSKEYFQALKKGTAYHYFRRIGGDYIFANQYLLTERDPYQANFGKYLSEPMAEFNENLVLWQVSKP